ncbi:hypothetical protein KRP22_014292 [Phytophthora ramorum]|nr:hypothetical protein KRP22_9108 [Phytophthora ramorum]
MSFLHREGDNFTTLHEASAFIDPSGDIDMNSAAFPLSEEIDELLGSMIEYSPEETEKGKTQNPTIKKKKKTVTAKKKKKKKRVRSPASSSTVLQRRRRADILSLRGQVTELQQVLNELLSGGDANSAILRFNTILKLKTYADTKVPGQMLSLWHRCAIEQYEMRNKSEKQYQQLKKILSQQKNTTSSLRRILRRQSLAQDMNYMKPKSPVTIREPLADNDVCRSMAQLESAVENMYQYATPQFEVGSTPALSSPVQTSYREQRKGDVVEFVVSTPMRCSMAEASNMILTYLEKERTPGSKPNALQMMEPLTLHHLDDPLQFEKLHYIRQFSEPEKIAFVCSDILLLRSKGLRFGTNGITTVVPLPADPLRTCVVHLVLKLRVDNEPNKQALFAKDIALGALSKAIRLFWQSEQSRLADEAVRISGESSYAIL